jgi:hypothetical protein
VVAELLAVGELFLRPPMVRTGAAAIDSRAPERNFFGSASNFAAQPFEQK